MKSKHESDPNYDIDNKNQAVCHNRGEGEIEKVFVIDAHGFIRQ